MTSVRATASPRVALFAGCALPLQTLGCDVGNSVLVLLSDASTNDPTLGIPNGAVRPIDGASSDSSAGNGLAVSV